MRRTVLVLALLALAVVALVLWSTAPSDGPTELDAGAARATPEASASEVADVAPLAVAPGPEPERTTAEAPPDATPAARPAVDPDVAVLLARAIDDSGAPVADAEFTLNSVGGPWAAGKDVPKRPSGTREIEGYAATSDASGRIRLEVVVPTSDWISMRVEAGPYRSRAGRDFGPAGGRNKPRIAPGVNELGDFALTATGIVRGRVRGTDGTPIANAEVRLEGHFPGDFSVNTRAGADGAYELGRMPPGSWPVMAKADGWTSKSSSGVEVTANRTTEAVDFVLERAPSIRGVVVDETGAPVSNVRVWGWPVSSGQGAGGTTDAAGAFTIFLPQTESYDLEVTRQAQFEDWGAGRAQGERFEPGTDDVRIVLKRKAQTTFRVVDAATGAPVTRYALAFENVPEEGRFWNRFDRIPEPGDHPEGVTTKPAALGKQDVGVVAPGYAPLQARVAHDADAPGVQTLRLARESTAAFVLQHDGAPVGGATVRIEREGTPGRRGSSASGSKLDDLSGRKRDFTSGADGTLRIDGLAAGTHMLTIDARGLARTQRLGVEIPASAHVDLGVVEVGAAAKIAGRVIVPASSSPIGLKLRVGHGFERELTITNADGTFTVDGLEAGEHEVRLEPVPPLVVSIQTRKVTLASGETKEVVFDLVAEAPCRIELVLLNGGRPVEGLNVAWYTEDLMWTSNAQTITSDANGIARGHLPGGKSGGLWIARDFAAPVLRRAIPAGLPAGGVLSERIELALGRVAIELPATLVIPENGGVYISLEIPGDPMSMRGTQFLAGTRAASPVDATRPRWTGASVAVEEVPAGEYTLRVTAHRSEFVEGQRTPASIVNLFESPPRTVRVESGATCTVDLRTP